MVFRNSWRSIILAPGLIACGAILTLAWSNGLWGSLAGAALGSIWLTFLNDRTMVKHRPPFTIVEDSPRQITDRLLLDVAPTPMLEIGESYARALNRAARLLFATDDRILPVPVELFQPGVGHMRHEGRQLRIDRVRLGGKSAGRVVVALIDVEQEERVAEERAIADMTHVLGHELLNGLAPIVSLAESAETIIGRPGGNPALLREILGTLARRADGLQRFTEAYRKLARLPSPRLDLVSLSQLAGDMAHLFAGRWPGVELVIDVEEGPVWPLDRDQISQALWALLQNAAEAASGARGEHARVCLQISAEQGSLNIRVQDNGEGVESENAKRIFRPFHTTKPNGTGIGLSLARQIAHAHGGDLSLLSMKPATFLLNIRASEITG